MLKIFQYLKKKEWLFVAFSVVFIVTQVYLDLKIPDFIKKLTTLIQTPGSQISEVLQSGGYMILCAFGSLISAITVGFFASKIASGLSMTLRGKIYDKVMSYSMAEINKFSTSSLINRSTNDVTQVQMIVAMGLQILIKAPITAVWAIIKISSKSADWTTLTAVAVVILIIMLSIITILALPKFKVIQKYTDDLNRVTRENLTGIRVVRAYNAENYQQEKFEVVNKTLTKTNLFTSRLMAIMMPSISFIMSGLTLGIYFLGATIINNSVITNRLNLFTDMMIFSSYAMQILMSFMMLIMIFIMLPRAAVSAKRILEVLETNLSVVDGTLKDVDLKVEKIEFKNVGFKFSDNAEYVLKDINFTAHKGDKVAFIGSTGSGKSTLINLIPRFYDVTEGEILIDDINIKQLSLKKLRKHIGYVSQKAVLFSGTVASNVTFGDKVSETMPTDITEAIDIAQATEFVNSKKNDVESLVAQGGSNFSGGQKQRISIARAVYRKPDIFIFDDTFSALDYKTDRKLRTALKNKTKDSITLIVAQRIGTIMDVDKIIVIDNGEIVGMGTHKELLNNCEVYREIALSQLSEKELV